MSFDMSVIDVVLLVVALVIAIVGHEIMHGWVAYKFGDTTAKIQGRLSINPIRHIDPIGTIVVPVALYITSGMMFGWAKPVPVNMGVVFKNGGYKAGVFVALAGIFYNILLAVSAIFLLKTFGIWLRDSFGDLLLDFLLYMFSVNMFLALFNLYPIPPLDGSKALTYSLLSFGFRDLANKIYSLERYGMVILVVIMISPLSEYFSAPIKYVFRFFANL